MSKFILVTAFFLLPFIAFTTFAQYELPKLALPSDNIITYELDDTDEDKSTWQRRSPLGKVIVIILLVILGSILVFGLMALLGANVLSESG